jgi:hypothetical protein
MIVSSQTMTIASLLSAAWRKATRLKELGQLQKLTACCFGRINHILKVDPGVSEPQGLVEAARPEQSTDGYSRGGVCVRRRC